MAEIDHPDSLYASLVPETDPVPYTPPPGSGSSRAQAGPKVGQVNPLNAFDVEKLREAMDWSARQFESFITTHAEGVQMYAGGRYNRYDRGISKQGRTPFNIYSLAVNIWMRQLVTQSPRTLVLTKFPSYKTNAYELELGTNHLLKATNFGATLEDIVLNAIFGMGIVKVGITDKYMKDAYGYSAASGQPYASSVLLEDWLHDMNARKPEEFDWSGNRYRVPLDLVMQNPNYDQAAKDVLDRVHTGRYELGLAGSNAHVASQLSREEQSMHQSEYHEHVELWDVWLPLDKLLVTMPAHPGSKPLQIREWEGPENGPFGLLQFGRVPGNLMPSAPAQGIYDMQATITKIFNQLSRQALRQKSLTIVDGMAEADGTAAKLRGAVDGEMIYAQHAEGVKQLDQGGVNEGNVMFLTMLKDLMDYASGNISSMGGLAQSAETLGQEKMLSESSSEMLRDMQSRVIDFSERTITDLSWYMYTDPTIELPLTKPIEGYGDIPFTYGPENRKADFFSYAFEIQPYSLKSKSPGERLNAILEMATSVLIPLAPQMAEWGMTFNLKRLVELIGKYADMPEIAELVDSMMPLESEAQPPPGHGPRSGTGGQRALQSPVTQRNYTRTNMSTGGTQKNRDLQLMQSLMSSAQNQGQSQG